jgi:integrase
MKGTVTKRCPCPAKHNAKGKVLACDKRHGSWSIVADVGRDPQTGKRRQIRKSGYATRAEAEAALTVLLDAAGKGVVPARRNETFKSYADAWLETRSRRVRATTADGYRSALAHGIAAFGSKPLGDVTRRDVERVAAALTNAGRAQRTSSYVLFGIRSVFQDAVDEGLLPRNPAARIDAVGRPPKDREALSAADMVKLRSHLAKDRLSACWLLTMYGLRRSEVLGGSWADVDLATGVLSISRGVVADSSGRRREPTATKTRRGTRTLPLPADVLAALRKLRESQAGAFGFEHVRSGYLAVNEAGVPYRPERWSDMWRELCAAAGVQAVTLHAARHSSVTAMRRAGVPDDVVAAWHGHDEVVMRRTYSHPDADGLAAAGAALSGVFADAASGSVTSL